MYLNKFSARINGKGEDSGYVEMKHGETYTIVLKNDHNVRCDATVEVDGKDIGTFRIEAHSNIYIERPSNEQKKFTFYQLGTSEATQSGLNKVEKNEMGLIKVTFKPEKIWHVAAVAPTVVTVEPEKPQSCWVKPQNWVTTSTTHNTLTRGRGFLKSAATTEERGWDSYGGSTADNCNYMLDSETICDTPQAVTTRACFREASLNEEPVRAGGTGLSGHSNQRFTTVSGLEYDEERITVVHLRLVPVKEIRVDPTELKPVVKSTPIPPPLFTLLI